MVSAVSEIDRILSGRNQPSVPEREAVFDEVFKKLEAAGEVGNRTRARLAWGRPLMALALGGVLALAITVLSPREAEFGSRGANQNNVELRCSDGCRKGSTLVVTVASNAPYFSAFSQAPDGTVTWYFTSQTLENGRHPLRQAIRIGDHAVGTHKLFGLFTQEPLTREALRARFDQLERVERSFVVSP